MHWPKTEARCKSSGQATKLEHRRFPAVLRFGRNRCGQLDYVWFDSGLLPRSISLPRVGLTVFEFGQYWGEGSTSVVVESPFHALDSEMISAGVRGPSSMSFRPPFFRAEDSWPRSARRVSACLELPYICNLNPSLFWLRPGRPGNWEMNTVRAPCSRGDKWKYRVAILQVRV